MTNRLKWPRILVTLAALMLAGAVFLPIWRIELSAPQYPEGLLLQIYAKGLAGDVDVVNGLNHYIGMNTLHSEDFIEFTLLPYIIGFLVIFGLLAALINRRKLYIAYIAVFMIFAVVSLVDFYRWEYNYGHNLDPNAAIQIPGMSYQPPLIGYKQLLNFGAYSIPDTGGWLFIGAGVLLFLAFILILDPKWLPFRKRETVAFIVLLSMQSCTSGPQPINYGNDACDFCRMTIMDKRFSCEWVSDKGKVFRFDDVVCLTGFYKTNKGNGDAYVNDYLKGEFHKAEDLFFVKSESLKSPMGGKVAAFIVKGDAEGFIKNNDGDILKWQQVHQELQHQ